MRTDYAVVGALLLLALVLGSLAVLSGGQAGERAAVTIGGSIIVGAALIGFALMLDRGGTRPGK